MAAVVRNQHNLLFSACLLWKTNVARKFLCQIGEGLIPHLVLLPIGLVLDFSAM